MTQRNLTTNTYAMYLYDRSALKFFTTGLQADPTYIRALLCKAEALTEINQVYLNLFIYLFIYLFISAPQFIVGLVQGYTHVS